MKSHNLNRDVAVSEELTTSSFTIRANAKMFAILADKLYSDKPRAVVREIACNALDAHGMNGQTRPFKIAAPSALEPMLTIRDYGPGMSDAMVMEVYTAFGASTKDNDDVAVGGFGLGCKSPFAYADAFTVSVWMDGERRDYAAYRGPDGVPLMSQVSKSVAEDPDETGVEVRVPVKSDDFRVFKATIEDVLKYFPAGSFEAYGVDVPVVTYTSMTATYGVRVGDEHYLPSVALMGPVAYPLDWSKVLNEGDTALPRRMVPIFQIGELDLLPSREGLSYDKPTIAKLRERYLEIVQNLADDMFTHVQTLTPAQQVLYIEDAKSNGTWKFVHLRFPNEDPLKPSEGFPGVQDTLALPGVPMLTEVDRASWRGPWMSGSKLEVTSERKGENAKVTAKRLNGDVYFIFDDIADEKEAHRRITTRYKELAHKRRKSTSFIVFDKTVPLSEALSHADRLAKIEAGEPIPEMEYGYVGGVSSVDEIKALLIGWDKVDTHVLNMSDLPLPVREKVVRDPSQPKVKTDLRVLSCSGSNYGTYNYSGRSNWEVTQLPDDGVFAPMTNYDLEAGFNSKWMKYAFVEQIKVLGLSKKARAEIKRDGNEGDFERVDHYVQRMAKEALHDPAVLAELQRRHEVELLESDPEVAKVLNVVNCSEGRKLFPSIGADLDRLNRPRDEDLHKRVQALLDYLRRERKDPPKPKKVRASVAKAIMNVYYRSPLLRFAVQHHAVGGHNIFYTGGANLAQLAQLKGAEPSDQ